MTGNDAVPPAAAPGSPPPERTGAASYDPRAAAKLLLRTVRSGALATLTAEGDPYASLVTVATLPDGSPVLPLSTLAVHTGHLMADPRCSLLLESAGAGDPLTHPRLTITARAVAATADQRAAWRARFLRRHPKAEIYVDFGDFAFWRLVPTGGRIIGGFGRIAMLDAADLATDLAGAEALVAAEMSSIDHMNTDHRAALALYATAFCGAPDGDWRLVGLDPEGIDLGWRDATLRLPFPERLSDPAALRRQLGRWVDEAKARAATASPTHP